MKNKIFLLILFSVLFLTFPSQASAHPGNTSYDGCHFCKTRCTYWGKTYGTRHGHYGQVCDPALGPIDPLYTPYSEPEPTLAPTPKPTPKPTLKPTPIPTPKSTLTPASTSEPTVAGEETEAPATQEPTQPSPPKPLTPGEWVIFLLILVAIVGIPIYVVLRLIRRLKNKFTEQTHEG